MIDWVERVQVGVAGGGKVLGDGGALLVADEDERDGAPLGEEESLDVSAVEQHAADLPEDRGMCQSQIAWIMERTSPANCSLGQDA